MAEEIKIVEGKRQRGLGEVLTMEMKRRHGRIKETNT
jgi:hypothetical protein